MNRMTSASVAACALLLLGVASPVRAQGAGLPISRLERAREASPRSAAVLRALGIVYFRAGRHADALAALTEARRLSPRDGVAALYAGMSAEALGNISAAREAYATYLRHGRTRRVRYQLAARLAALNRRELAARAKESLAAEGALRVTGTTPRVVAVPPFSFAGTDSTLRPLGRGLADLVITDLSRSSQLILVERDRMQALLDEIARSGTGRGDSATALRAGRIVGAGRLVQGALTQLPNGSLRVDAAVIDVPTTAAVDAVSDDDRLEQLFALEKRIVFDLFEALGVTLTANERALVEQRPTRSMAAFVSYSAGLASADSGNLGAAIRHFSEAARQDPEFSAARARREEAEEARAGENLTTTSIESALDGTPEGEIVAAAVSGLTDRSMDRRETLAMTVESINPSPILAAAGGTLDGVALPVRDPASALTNTDTIISGLGTLIIIIRNPLP